VLAAEHLFRLGRFDLDLELVERTREIGRDVFARARPLDENRQVLPATLQRIAQLAVFLEPPLALEDLLGLGLVVPEVRGGNALLDLLDLLLRMRRVKDTSASPPRACRAPRTAASNRRAQLPHIPPDYSRNQSTRSGPTTSSRFRQWKRRCCQSYT
jgi:hypothetical protein